ncbi:MULTISPECIES: hypothetical protein [Streptomyces]|uniref:Uncharacterized protein n=1 Tax=Streptomyces canarius TaxID=285453 RepID=A0ABQ3DDA6_9ACTN|nr:hypothetical protein [Streptomyces canarius]GHA77462.1 hypothetical protein GCM10010345_93860 [Streptomyces canarius]
MTGVAREPRTSSPQARSTVLPALGPPSVEDSKEGRVRTVLSGRSLIALLIELWNTRSTATPLEGDWAMAMTSYNRIAAELADVARQRETTRIVLNDGLPHEAGD